MASEETCICFWTHNLAENNRKRNPIAQKWAYKNAKKNTRFFYLEDDQNWSSILELGAYDTRNVDMYGICQKCPRWCNLSYDAKIFQKCIHLFALNAKMFVLFTETWSFIIIIIYQRNV